MRRRGAAIAAVLQLVAAGAAAEPALIRIDAPITTVHARFVELALREAKREGNPLVILMDGSGGRLDAALRIRDDLRRAKAATTCFVAREAHDEAALACLGAARVELATGARLGCSAEVRASATGERERRRVARLRDEWATAAGAGNRLVELTAIELGVVDATDSALPRGMERAMPKHLAVAARLATPVASGVLLGLGLLGVLVEARIRSRLAGAAGLLALGVFFAAQGIAGLAGWTDAALGALGLVLLAVEIFALPGFGACGLVGLLFFGAGVLLALAGHDVALALASGTLRMALLVTASAALAAAAALAVAWHVVPPRSSAGSAPA